MRFYQVDAFTRDIFHGNPAGVCIVEDVSEDWMRHMADEIHASETAFLTPIEGGYSLRWFTPADEVDLCGHATLASAHILYTQGYADPKDTLAFHTKSGILRARMIDGMIELDFPAEPAGPVEAPPHLLEGLGATPVYIGRNRMDYIVEIPDDRVLRELKPDLFLLSQVDTRGIIVTARSADDTYDFVSRFFAPALDVPEDPVTGSAHCCLAPYWRKALAKDSFHACQASPRGGELWVSLKDGRVFISGHAVTAYTGDIPV